VNYRSIFLVLDASAVVEFTRGSIHVGEPLAEINEDDGGVGIPFLCLSDALPAIHDLDQLQILVTHPAVRVLSDEPWSWRAHAATCDIVGRPSAASAALAAMNSGVPVLTRQPGLYAGLADGDLAVAIPD
jgi:hypothetical protein